MLAVQAMFGVESNKDKFRNGSFLVAFLMKATKLHRLRQIISVTKTGQVGQKVGGHASNR